MRQIQETMFPTSLRGRLFASHVVISWFVVSISWELATPTPGAMAPDAIVRAGRTTLAALGGPRAPLCGGRKIR
jgi:hypothetical protein